MEIAYRTEERAPAETRLEEDDDGGCVVTFKLMPRWLTVLPVGMAFAVASMHLLGSAYVIWTLWSSPFLRAVLGVGVWKMWTAFWIPGLGWVGIAVAILRSYRLYGRVPRSLAVHKGSGTLSSRREASARWRSWRLEAVASVRVLPVKSVVPGKVGARVVISIRGKMLPMGIYFSAPDAGLAERFAEKLRGAAEAFSAKRQA